MSLRGAARAASGLSIWRRRCRSRAAARRVRVLCRGSRLCACRRPASGQVATARARSARPGSGADGSPDCSGRSGNQPGSAALDEAEELTVGTDPDRGLTNRERNQLRVRHLRSSTGSSSDPTIISEDAACNNGGFQIGRHLEPPSQGTRLEAEARPHAQPASPCPGAAVSHQASSRTLLAG
jgi:hypothetical protein